MSDYKEKWGKLNNREDKELKQIAKDLYANNIYTSIQAAEDTLLVFMPLSLMGPKMPEKPSIESSNSTEDNRDIVASFIENEDKLTKQYEKDMEQYEIEYEYYQNNFISSIGLVFEYYDKSLPRGINFKPIFGSCQFLNKEDTIKTMDYYKKYKEMSENF